MALDLELLFVYSPIATSGQGETMAKSKGTTREVHEKTFGKERDKMIEATTAEINKTQ